MARALSHLLLLLVLDFDNVVAIAASVPRSQAQRNAKREEISRKIEALEDLLQEQATIEQTINENRLTGQINVCSLSLSLSLTLFSLFSLFLLKWTHTQQMVETPAKSAFFLSEDDAVLSDIKANETSMKKHKSKKLINRVKHISPVTVEDVVASIKDTIETLKQSHLTSKDHKKMIEQIYERLFKYLNASLFNELIRREDLSSASTGFGLKLAISYLSMYLSSLEEPYASILFKAR